MEKTYEREISCLNENTSDALILSQIKPGAVVLECGCGTGYMTRYMKENLGAQVYIVEQNAIAFNKAMIFAKGGVCADLQELNWGICFSDNDIQFDYVIFADVLEHLKNPEAVLRYASSLMKENGCVLVSIPNIAHNDIILNLCHNQWNYKELGILDNTHIHFWGKENLTDLCFRAGLAPEIMDYVIVPPFSTEQALTVLEDGDMPLVSALSHCKYLDIYQFVITLRKNAYLLSNMVTFADRYEERHSVYGLLPQCCVEWENEQKILNDKQEEERVKALVRTEIHNANQDMMRALSEITEQVQTYSPIIDNMNGLLMKQSEENDDASLMLKNLSRTSEDMRYVIQNSPWYHKTLKNIERPSFLFRLVNSLRMFGIFGCAKKVTRKTIKTLYRASKKNVFLYSITKKSFNTVEKSLPRLGERLSAIVSEEKSDMMHKCAEIAKRNCGEQLYWKGEKRKTIANKPLVSVIVPNYNHAPYLRKRLESIYGQTYTNIEVILLDDCSTDNSRDILTEYAKRFPEKTTVHFNEVNGGKVFKQWNKGIESANGKLIWIAESDDWCELDFLEKMVPRFEYESVMLTFCRSVFMQDGKRIWTLEEYLNDLPELSFESPFIISAHMAVRSGFGIKNIIPNVSSVLFRKTGIIPKEITDLWENTELCGDWLFYLHTIIGGCVSYTNETTNYYRVHKNSTSLKIQKKPEYYREQELISVYIASHYSVDLSLFEQVQRNLENHYKTLWKTNEADVVHDNYHLDRIKENAKKRKPNVLMCGFAMQIGGGETYPIILANELKAQGIAVTFLNFNMESYSDVVRNRLNPSIPMVTIESTAVVGSVLRLLGGEVVHSHHASVDNILSIWLESMKDFYCKQVVTLHGMYEMMDYSNCKRCLTQLEKTCEQIIYIAEKNYACFEKQGFQDKFRMYKMDNGLPRMPFTKIERAILNIPDDAFVFCLVSRALREKGWLEAAEAVISANRESINEIHLILVGDGEMREKILSLNNKYIHVVGQQSNVCDYFATADMGILPSYYKGERYPLVLNECLLTGKPVLATDLGEVRHQLEDADGELAGILIPIIDWKLDFEELKRQMLRVSSDKELYQTLCARVPGAAEKIDIKKIVKRHIEIYEENVERIK